MNLTELIIRGIYGTRAARARGDDLLVTVTLNIGQKDVG